MSYFKSDFLTCNIFDIDGCAVSLFFFVTSLLKGSWIEPKTIITKSQNEATFSEALKQPTPALIWSGFYQTLDCLTDCFWLFTFEDFQHQRKNKNNLYLCTDHDGFLMHLLSVCFEIWSQIHSPYLSHLQLPQAPAETADPSQSSWSRARLLFSSAASLLPLELTECRAGCVSTECPQTHWIACFTAWILSSVDNTLFSLQNKSPRSALSLSDVLTLCSSEQKCMEVFHPHTVSVSESQVTVTSLERVQSCSSSDLKVFRSFRWTVPWI